METEVLFNEIVCSINSTFKIIFALYTNFLLNERLQQISYNFYIRIQIGCKFSQRDHDQVASRSVIY